MSDHPSDVELRGFVHHTLAADRVLTIDDHLAECPACRARASSIGRVGAKLVELAADALVVETHLTDEDIQQYAVNELPAGGKERLARHVAECETCRRAVADLQRWASAPPKRHRRVYWAAAAAAILILSSPLAISRWFSDDAPPGTLAIPGLELLTADQQRRVTEALQAGVVEPPAILAEMMTGSEVLMGAASTQPFRLDAPLMTVTVADRPTFRWQAMPGAEEYIIAVLDADLRPVAGPITLRDTTWTPAAPLARGGSYVWQVSARRGSTSVTVPAPPAPPARFRVMNAADASAVERVSRASPDAHLLLGIMLAQAGARQDAEVHLRQVSPGDPDASVARRTLERLGTPSAAP